MRQSIRNTLFFVLSMLVPTAAMAKSNSVPCRVNRQVSACSGSACRASALADFQRYAQSEAACGVYPKDLPYISLAPGHAKGTVVTIHGLSANPSHFGDLVTILNREGYNVVLPILYGQGGLDDFFAQANYDEWKKDTSFAGIEAQKLGDGPVFLLGHSTGGVMAALEAEQHPGAYAGFIGFDPALNLSGKNSNGVQYSCAAAHFWNFPTDMKNGLLKPFFGKGPPLSREEDIRQIASSNTRLVQSYCGTNFTIPDYNYEFSLAGICALDVATHKFAKLAPHSLPPSLLVLSQDHDIYGVISKDDMRKAFAAQDDDTIYESDFPLHVLMLAHCSPGFDAAIAKTLQWLSAHNPTSH